ncbi:alpha/beta hydrolase [Vitiosangium sp. GDMCC 1.1324]|uniref:alpha/beta hydrolase n=1 Tax=Vitiosangium sp. (strain GDMCC 1.1324) TaxID=2138576 RepID=UPI000D3477B6|nr:alpha/beta hydrolase [Vitiosangium sp. GDMCC 1.1324]PTL79730.1 alpha/beta hydrolase [Vitiosangium sp. GDMCC 1.1324]
MNVLRTLVPLLRAMVLTALSCMRHGPLRPGWTFSFEMLMAWFRGLPPCRDEASLLERRAFSRKANPSSPAMREVDFSPVDAGGVPAEWVTPRAGAAGPVVFYVHGGGYVVGSVQSYRGTTAQLAVDSGARVLVVDYRLAPEHPYPAALEDALAAWRWLRGTGVEPSRVVVAGDSSGGGLVLSLLRALVDSGEWLPAGAVLLSPWVDLSCEAPSHVGHAPYDYLHPEELRFWGRCYAGTLELKDPRLSPLYASARGLPPLYLQVGGAELFLDPVCELAGRARAEGVSVTLDVCEGLPHLPTAFGALLPAAREAAVRAGEAVRRLVEDAERARARMKAVG